jgi:uncharacterized protein (DUF924 family)
MKDVSFCIETLKVNSIIQSRDFSVNFHLHHSPSTFIHRIQLQRDIVKLFHRFPHSFEYKTTQQTQNPAADFPTKLFVYEVTLKFALSQ